LVFVLSAIFILFIAVAYAVSYVLYWWAALLQQVPRLNKPVALFVVIMGVILQFWAS
jgi:hypothetical protein